MTSDYGYEQAAKLPPLKSLFADFAGGGASSGQHTRQRGAGGSGPPPPAPNQDNVVTKETIPPSLIEWLNEQVRPLVNRVAELENFRSRIISLDAAFQKMSTLETYVRDVEGYLQKVEGKVEGYSTLLERSLRMKNCTCSSSSACQQNPMQPPPLPMPMPTAQLAPYHQPMSNPDPARFSGSSIILQQPPVPSAINGAGPLRNDPRVYPTQTTGPVSHSHPSVATSRGAPPANGMEVDGETTPVQTKIAHLPFSPNTSIAGNASSSASNAPGPSSSTNNAGDANAVLIPKEEPAPVDHNLIVARANHWPVQLRPLAIAIYESDWLRRQLPEPPVEATDPFVMSGLLRPGDSRFGAFYVPTEENKCLYAEATGTACNRKSSRVSRAVGHVRKHFGYTPFECAGQCGKRMCRLRFSEAGSLHEHIRRLEKSSIVKCQFCPKTITARNFARHLKHSHPDRMEQVTKGSAFPQTNGGASGSGAGVGSVAGASIAATVGDNDSLHDGENRMSPEDPGSPHSSKSDDDE